MATVPLAHSSADSPIIGALTLVSSCKNAFTECACTLLAPAKGHCFLIIHQQ